MTKKTSLFGTRFVNVLHSHPLSSGCHSHPPVSLPLPLQQETPIHPRRPHLESPSSRKPLRPPLLPAPLPHTSSPGPTGRWIPVSQARLSVGTASGGGGGGRGGTHAHTPPREPSVCPRCGARPPSTPSPGRRDLGPSFSPGRSTFSSNTRCSFQTKRRGFTALLPPVSKGGSGREGQRREGGQQARWCLDAVPKVPGDGPGCAARAWAPVGRQAGGGGRPAPAGDRHAGAEAGQGNRAGCAGLVAGGYRETVKTHGRLER